ncbi:hypothetical protein [Escherichia phage UPEC06]|nr:hypothetical protein [Escherichia phage UPEC06]
MHYSQNDKIEFEVGDLIVNRSYDNSPFVEVVTFVGEEGVVVHSIGGIVGMLERYIKYSKVTDSYPRIYHKRNAETYIEFVSTLNKGE